MAKSAARVLGPYRNGDKWRLVVIEGPARKSIVVDSVENALAVREELAAALKKQTAPQLTELLDEYLQGLLARGVQAETVEKISRMLRGFLPVHEPAAAISAERAQQLYLTETHRKKANGQAIAAGPDIRRTVDDNLRAFAKPVFTWKRVNDLASANRRHWGITANDKTIRRQSQQRRFQPKLRETFSAGSKFFLAKQHHARQHFSGAKVQMNS